MVRDKQQQQERQFSHRHRCHALFYTDPFRSPPTQRLTPVQCSREPPRRQWWRCIKSAQDAQEKKEEKERDDATLFSDVHKLEFLSSWEQVIIPLRVKISVWTKYLQRFWPKSLHEKSENNKSRVTKKKQWKTVWCAAVLSPARFMSLVY